MSRSTWILMIAVLLAGTTAVGEIYKWVDDKGGVHYGDCAPPDCAAVPVGVAPPPSDAAVREAGERLERLRRHDEQGPKGHAVDDRPASRGQATSPALRAPADPGCLASLSQGWTGRIADAREPVSPRLLSKAERLQLQALLRAMAGRWEGRAEDVRCAGEVTAPSTEVVAGRSRLHARWQTDDLFKIDVDVLWNSGASDRWFYSFQLDADHLRFWKADTDFANESDMQRFDVELVSVGSDGVTFFQRYDQGLRRARVISLSRTGGDFRLGEFFYLEGQMIGKQSWTFSR